MLIVDDHARFRDAARALLEAAGFEVVGAAADGSSALREVARLRPDVVLLDVRLPDFDGFLVAERIAELEQPPNVVLVSSRSAADFGARIDESPARGFITKRALTGPALAALLP